MTANSPDHPHEPPADTEYPSELKITSTPYEQQKADTLDRIEQWEAGEDVPHVVNFQDASRLQRVLTPRRLELIRSLLDGSADSIRALADRLDRDVRQVHDDVDLLNEYGIVRFHEDGTAKGPFIPYETISIEVELSKPTGEPSDSTASA
jgi:predicted transcriptional regulator